MYSPNTVSNSRLATYQNTKCRLESQLLQIQTVMNSNLSRRSNHNVQKIKILLHTASFKKSIHLCIFGKYIETGTWTPIWNIPNFDLSRFHCTLFQSMSCHEIFYCAFFYVYLVSAKLFTIDLKKKFATEKDFNTTPLIMSGTSSAQKKRNEKREKRNRLFRAPLERMKEKEKEKKSRRFNFEFNGVIKQDDTAQTRSRTIKRFTYTARFMRLSSFHVIYW